MDTNFHREYTTQLPLPLAQLYSRAYNAKDSRSRHDNTFYLFEALIKLMAAPLVAAYLHKVSHQNRRSEKIDRLLVHLASPSLGQWLQFVRELAQYFSKGTDNPPHSLSHLWDQLTHRHVDKPGLIALYQRIKNGPDGELAGVQNCSLLQMLEALVQYRNAVFGHGANRVESFYQHNLDTCLFPAINEILASKVLSPLGPLGTHLIFLNNLTIKSEQTMEVGFHVLVGYTGERSSVPLTLPRETSEALIPQCVAVIWPGKAPLRLDPLLIFQETDQLPEVMFLNRDRSGKRVEYLSYTTGRTEHDQSMASSMIRLMRLITDREISQEELAELSQQSVSDSPIPELVSEPESLPLLGDYEILAEIGRGSMGVVYLVQQLSLGRIVALKLLPDDLLHDDAARVRFRREIRVLANCDHPNIIKVFTSGTLPDGRLYYTMEYVPGADLEQIWLQLANQSGKENVSHLGNSTFMRAVINASGKQRQAAQSRFSNSTHPGIPQRTAEVVETESEAINDIRGAEHPIPPLPLPALPPLPSVEDDPGGYIRTIVGHMHDAALALQTIHDQNIIHRDVKPANLMLTPDGSRVVLMDFGLAKGEDPTLAASRVGGLLGTLRYASPEQLAAANLKVGPAADVRGLGVTLWELLTQRQLFAEAKDEAQLAVMIHESDVPLLRKIDSGFDRDLEAIVARATERRMSDRIQSAGLLAEYLQRYLDGKPLPIRPPSSAELGWRWIQGHRSALVAGCFGLVLLLAGAYGAWYWNEYVRVHVRYYTNFVRRWGVPEGIGKISQAISQQRNITYKFSFRGRHGPVIDMMVINGHGRCASIHGVEAYIGDSLQNNFTKKQECRWEYETDDSGYATNERVYDSADRFVYAIDYTSHNIGMYKDQEGRPSARSKSSAVYVEFTRSEDGLDTSHHYFESSLAGEPQLNHEGVYGTRFHYDTRGLPDVVTGLGINGNSFLNKNRFAIVKKQYDAHGNVTEKAYFDEQGQPIHPKGGYAIEKSQYGPHGNVIKKTYFDGPGQPNRGQFGIAMKYDSHGDHIESHFFDKQGQPTPNKDGIAIVKLQYGVNGNITRASYFDVHEQPIRNKNEYASIKWHYDSAGRIIKEAYFDGQGQPTLNKEGYASQKWHYDSVGRIIKEAYFDEQGQLTLRRGIAILMKKYDSHGNVTAIAFFDEQGTLTHHNGGVTLTMMEYDKRRNAIKEVNFDEQGQRIQNEDGVVILRKKYDTRGNVIEQATFDEQEQLIPTNQGNAVMVKRQFDIHGNMLEEAYFDEREQLTPNKNGVAIEKWQYDLRGNSIETVFFDEQSQPTLNKNGVAIEKRKYDTHRNIIEIGFFDKQGQLTLDNHGFAIMKMQYNEYGKIIESSFFDEYEQLIRHKGIAAIIKQQYDTRGNAIEIAYFDEHGQPTHVKGVARTKKKYDARGNVIEEAYFDNKGKATFNEYGDSILRKKYDERGNVIEERDFDDHGRPSSTTTTVVKKKYDLRGNLVERAYFDEQKLIVHIVKYQYDRYGRVVEETNFDDQGNPTRLNGYASLKKQYDVIGRVLKITYFDEQGQSIRNIETRYDIILGNVVQVESVFDEQGKLIIIGPGVKKHYDTDGKLIEETYFNDQGQAVQINGYARMKRQYDMHGNVVEVAFFDEQNQLTGDKNGVAVIKRQYNSRGKVVEEAYFNNLGKPKKNMNGEQVYLDDQWKPIQSNGYARIKRQYDVRGNILEVAFFDEQNKLIGDKNGIAVIKRQYNTRGKIVEEAYFNDQREPTLLKGYIHEYAVKKLQYNTNGHFVNFAYFNKEGDIARTTVTIVEVMPNTVAQKIGLLVGDILLSYSGKEVFNVDTFVKAVRVPGKKLRELRIQRRDTELSFQVAPGVLGIQISSNLRRPQS